MLNQLVAPVKFQFAVRVTALVGLVHIVPPLVVISVRTRGENLTADLTGEEFFATMHSHVLK